MKLPDIAKTETVSDGNGLFITRIIFRNACSGPSKAPPVSITIIDQNNLTVASALLPIKACENFRVIQLPPGRYSWRGIYIGTYYAEFRGKLLFDIIANKANYVGDINLVIDLENMKYSLKVVDQSRIVNSLYETKYPVAAKALPFITEITEDNRLNN